MRLERKFDIAIPIESMYSQINDIGQIGYCIAGVKDVQVLNDSESQWKIEARAGFMARTFNLHGTIVERRPPEYIAFAGRGQDVEVTGHVQLTQTMPAVTSCEVIVEANVTGAFAPIVDLMARGPQEALIQQTISNLRRRLESAGTLAESVPSELAALEPLVDVLQANKQVGTTIFDRLRRWLGFRRRVMRDLSALTARVKSIEDERGIVDTLNRFADAIDRGALAECMECFARDGVLEIRRPPIVNGTSSSARIEAKRYATQADLRSILTELIQAGDLALVVQRQIRLEGSGATAVSYFIRGDADESTLHTYAVARHEDRLARSADGRWRLEERVIYFDIGRKGGSFRFSGEQPRVLDS